MPAFEFRIQKGDSTGGSVYGIALGDMFEEGFGGFGSGPFDSDELCAVARYLCELGRRSRRLGRRLSGECPLWLRMLQ